MDKCSESTGVVFGFERSAMHGEPIPHGLTVKEQVIYIGLRYLYGSYKREIISREQASDEKRRMLRDIGNIEKQEEAERHWQEQNAAMWKRIEAFAMAYEHDRTLENADRFHAAVYGLPFHEKGGTDNGKEEGQPTPEASV